MNVANVAKPSAVAHTSLSIREFTPERNPMRVMNVGKPSTKSCPLGYTREFMLEKNSIHVMHVGIILVVPPLLEDIREVITEKLSDCNRCRKKNM